MSKSQKIFGIIFPVLLLLMSISVVSFYDNVKDKVKHITQDNYSRYVNALFEEYTLYLVQQVDPTYEILSFNDNISKQDQEKINQFVNEEINSIRNLFENDNNLVYSIKNTKTNQTITGKNQLTGDDFYFQQTFKYDQNGNLDSEGSLNKAYFQNLNFDMVFESYAIMNNSDMLEHIKINIPKNVEISYTIPENVSDYNNISGYIMNDLTDVYFGYAIFMIIVYSIIIAIFMLFYPIRIVEGVNPFMTIKKWKAEINICIFCLAISLAIMATAGLTGYTLSNALILLFNNFYITNSQIIITIGNFVAWFITLLLISMAIFEVKYMFASGFIRFLKEDTLIGACLRFVKRKLDKIAEIDLSNPLEKNIMKYVLINTVIIIILISFFAFGYILAIIYAFVSFFWLKDKIEKIQADYVKLLNATKELGKGHFDEEINEDIGIFNGLKDEFNNIKLGFKKAVEEETISQSMKTELITNVSHDLKTPLTCIKNYIVLLQNENITEQQRRDYLESLNQYSNRLTTLIEDLFEISKVNSGNIQLNLINLNIVALLEQALAECNEILNSKNLIMITKFSNHEIMLYLDGDKTYRIFENLLMNISKYSMSNSRVYIDITEVENQVIIEFKNISEEQMNFTSKEIAERFVRGDKSRHENGSGLGLAIAKSFTEIQNGQFKIDIDGDLFKVIITFNRQ